MEKEKILVISIFSCFHVFKRFFLQGYQKSSLCGKGLICISVDKKRPFSRKWAWKYAWIFMTWCLRFCHLAGHQFDLLEPITRRQILDSSKLKEFTDNNFKFDENGRKVLIQIGRKLWEKEKLLVTSNFSFSHSVFKRLVSQGRQKVSLCGNGLKQISQFLKLWFCATKFWVLMILKKE